ncbi:unnamed protein product [Oikopleura dioica]|uniref:Uncharacterized protein n=1 Tax=Oikopleura dioica TaxID=34765 RepID=E4XPC2_OIKDI|nr:unnamed protein product [Oikopleura dioica]
MFSRAVLEAATLKAKKFGVTTETKKGEPLQGSKLHSQKNEFPQSREELIATAITDWKNLSQVRSIKPCSEVRAEMLFEGEIEDENAENPLAFNDHEKARKYLAEKADWRRIVFVSPYSKAKTFWVVHQEEKPEKAFLAISNFVAEKEGVAHQGEEWALSLTNESSFDPIELSSGPLSESSEITKKLQDVVKIKDLQRSIEPNGEEWRLARKGTFKRLREQEDDINEDLELGKMPWKLRQTWDDWANLKNEGIEENWKAVSEAELIGSGFWASLAIERIRRNITRAKADYERPNFGDRDWLTDIMEAGMEALHAMTAGISSRGLSPKKMAEKIEEAKDRFPALADRSKAKNGWITLKENQSTMWAKNRPKNQHTWICDILGDWQEEDSQAQVWTPLTRLLSAILLDLTYRQLRTQVRKSLVTKCESVGMQWNINQGRLTDRDFIQKWVRRTIEDCQEPKATTNIEILGEGQEQKIIWVPGKRDSQVWIFNLGKTAKKRHKMQLIRMAMHLRLHCDEAEALEKLAESEWTQGNVRKCLDVFKSSRNHIENDMILIKRATPPPAIRQLLQAIEAMINETKKQAPGSSSKLESVLINLTGGWSWAAGGQISFIKQPLDFLQTWMANRFRLTPPPRPVRMAVNKLPKVKITSKEWARRAIEVNEKMVEALINVRASYAEDEVQVEDFDSEEAAWKSSIAVTGGDISQLNAAREAIDAIKKPVNRRDQVEDLTSRGLVIYAIKEEPNREKLQASLRGQQHQNDFVEEIMRRINIEQPEDWAELAEILEEDVPHERSLTILMPQQEHAEMLAEALVQAGTNAIKLVTLSRTSAEESKSKRTPWLWKCFQCANSSDKPIISYTPNWAHPKVVDRMAKTLEKLAEEESWTENEKQVAKGSRTWEDLTSNEGTKLVPDAACTFFLRETHLDGIKAAQHELNQPATTEDFFPPEIDSISQVKGLKTGKNKNFRNKKAQFLNRKKRLRNQLKIAESSKIRPAIIKPWEKTQETSAANQERQSTQGAERESGEGEDQLRKIKQAKIDANGQSGTSSREPNLKRGYNMPG